MLTIDAVSGGGNYHAYLTSEYYLDDAQVVGWAGRGAEKLGLAGDVTEQSFQRVFNGFMPGGKKLVQNAGSLKHQPGWDLTFSAPKDVSAMWAVADAETRTRIGRCHEAAVRSTLEYLEDVAGLSRQDVGKGGKKEMGLVKAGLVIATFGHGASRERDPQLHTHCFVFNAGVRENGSTGALWSNEFFRHKMAAGALYQAALAGELARDLGIKPTPERHGFSIDGVPDELAREWSKRRDQIEMAVGSSASAEAAAIAAKATRRGKEPGKVSGLFEQWRETAAGYGFDAEKVKGLTNVIGVLDTPDKTRQFATTAAKAAELQLETKSHLSERELVRAVSNTLKDGTATAWDVRKAVSDWLGRSDVVAVGTVKGEARYTTRAVIDQERQLLADVQAVAERGDFRVRREDVERTLAERFPDTGVSADDAVRNRGQRAAVEHLLKPAGVCALSGMAGTGKSTVLASCREVWEKAGYRTTGMAIAGVAAKNLSHAAGIESDTLAMRLAQLDRAKEYAAREDDERKKAKANGWKYKPRKPGFTLDSKTVVVVDEAGMVGTKDMARLFGYVREAGAKLVLVGDSRQLQPVAAGAPFLRVENDHGRAELKHITRQSLDRDDQLPEWKRKAVTLFADGKAKEALDLFHERKLVAVERDRAKAVQKLVGDWTKYGGVSDPKSHLILAGTNDDVRALNTLCQRERLKELPAAAKMNFAEVNGQRVHEGDRVLFTKKDRKLGFENGDVGTVAKVTGLGTMKTISVLLDDGRSVSVPLAEYQDLRLGYAMTTHKAQGATVPNCYVLLGGSMQDLHLSYVQASRARESTRFYCDRFEAGKNLELIAKQMSQSRQKDLAHDLMNQHQQPT